MPFANQAEFQFCASMNETDLAAIMNQIDGVMMIGGADYHPSLISKRLIPLFL